jgi:hypothetical protein
MGRIPQLQRKYSGPSPAECSLRLCDQTPLQLVFLILEYSEYNQTRLALIQQASTEINVF